MPIKVKHLAEIALVVSDVAEAERFYNGILGFPVVLRDPGKSLVVRLGTSFLGLYAPGVRPEDVGHWGKNVHFVIYIDPASVDEAVRILKENNVTFWGPRDAHGEIHIDLLDPFGHAPEFWARKDFKHLHGALPGSMDD